MTDMTVFPKSKLRCSSEDHLEQRSDEGDYVRGFHASKVMHKILPARFQQYVN